MKASAVRPGMIVNGRKVIAATTGVGTFRVVKSTWSGPARIVVFADGSRVHFPLDADVAAHGYAESLPAGAVPSKAVKTPPKVRASRKDWRGEHVHGMSTREHDLIARTNMFDPGRVCGSVGASRDGVGSVRLTGPSFPGKGQ